MSIAPRFLLVLCACVAGGFACATPGAEREPESQPKAPAQTAARATAPSAADPSRPPPPEWAPDPGAGARVPSPGRPEPALEQARSVLKEHAPLLDALEQEAVAQLVARAGRVQDWPVTVLLGLMQQESRFDPAARGPRGSLGLMQIRPFVGEDIARRYGLPWRGERTLRDPVENVRIGLAYLSELRTRFDSIDHALAAYNMGPARLRRRLRDGQHTQNGPYVRKVHAKAAAFDEVGDPP